MENCRSHKEIAYRKVSKSRNGRKGPKVKHWHKIVMMKPASNLEVPSLDDYKEQDICEKALWVLTRTLEHIVAPWHLYPKPTLKETSICRTSRWWCIHIGEFMMQQCWQTGSDLGVERVVIVFRFLFELGIDGCKLNHGHHGHLVDDDDIHYMKSLEGQVRLL
jgi:hypothetical protein